MNSFPDFNPGTTASLIAFCLIIGFVFVNQYYFLRPMKTQIVRVYTNVNLLWIAIVSISVFLGWTRTFFPISVPLVILPTFALLIYFAKAGIGKILIEKSEKNLILASGFRLPLELVLHSWAETKTVPETMTWTGSNLDILPGVIAFLVLIPVFNRSWFHKFFFFLSTVMLINVMRVVMMSVNLPFSWNLTDPLQLIFEWPYCLIAIILVPWAFQLTIALGWKLMKNSY